MKVVHYTDEETWKLKPIKLEGGSKCLGKKPTGGLWVSPVGSNWGWKDWTKSEHFRETDNQYQIILDLDMTNIITIDNHEDLDKLYWFTPDTYYGFYGTWRSSYMGGELFAPSTKINFHQMLEDGVEAIYLTEQGQRATHLSSWHSKDDRDLYGWDCESVLILDISCIKSW